MKENKFFFKEGNLDINQIKNTGSFLEGKGIKNADTTLIMLLSHFTEISFSEIRNKIIMLKSGIKESLIKLDFEMATNINHAILALSKGEPVQYITGKTDFYGNDFMVNSSVLIPRFDTETIIDTVLPLLSDNCKILDLCCGSGCIGITLLLEAMKKGINPICFFADFSKEALSVTKENIKLHNVDNQSVTLIHDVKKDFLLDEFDIIISNPPYIPKEDIKNLSPEVLKEPVSALDGGEDGLDFYRIIAEKYKNNVKNNGFLVFECGIGQFEDICNIMKENDWSEIGMKKDLSNIERVVFGKNYRKT